MEDLYLWIGLPLLLTAWGWLSGHLPKFIAGLVSARLLASLKGAGIKDEDVRKYVQQITYATVVLAEAKFPDKGMGKEKYRMVFELLSKTFPFLAVLLKSQGGRLEELINTTAIEMDKTFKYLKKEHSDKGVIVLLPTAPEILPPRKALIDGAEKAP